MYNKLIILLTTIIFLVGCGTVSQSTKNNCISDNTKDITLRWGGHNYQTNALSGWQIDGNLNLYTFLKDSLNPNFKTVLIGNVVDTNKFCELLTKTKKLFVQIQALNAPGDSSHFVEFSQPKTNTNLRAVWNMRFKTYGSTEFRELFDSLNSLINNDKYVFQKKGITPGNSGR